VAAQTSFVFVSLEAMLRLVLVGSAFVFHPGKDDNLAQAIRN